MRDGALDLVTGLVIGGLAMSTGWGLFWLAIGAVGVMRGTCSWRVVLNSVIVSTMPLVIGAAVLWFWGESRGLHAAFVVGLGIMPLVLVGLGLRHAPDGQRAGAHMLGGVRHLMHELTGKHQGCGGCGHEHEHGGCS